jgi:hypothetical protein
MKISSDKQRKGSALTRSEPSAISSIIGYPSTTMLPAASMKIADSKVLIFFVFSSCESLIDMCFKGGKGGANAFWL